MIFSQKKLPTIHFYQPTALVRITGEDAFNFLQGQFTNDLRHAEGSVTYGLWLNQKGKVMADSQVLKLAENEFLLFSTTSAASEIVNRLEKFIIADDVFLENEAEKYRGVSLWGQASGEKLSAMLNVLPAAGQFERIEEAVVFNGRRTAGENYEIVGSESQVENWQTKLRQEGCHTVNSDAAELARISSGIPSIPHDIGPADLPNEAGLEAEAISFTKGCYLGQEIMARLKNLGQVRRQLRSVHGTGAPPKTGTVIFQREKRVGEIRTAVSNGDGFTAMAMVTRMGLDPDVGFSFEPTDGTDHKTTVWTS